MLGETVGSYQITALLSVGGMGSVYTATHALIGRAAAVKMLLPEFSQNRDIVQRFFNEAKATAAIRHPGIVEIFDFGYHSSGQAYLVMELLHGEPLSARFARDKILPEETSILLMRSIVGALGAAHARGIVHRDLKPDNVFLVHDPDVPLGIRPKLLDFGIAKLTDNQHTANATRTGVVMGTPTYMSPEQCRGSGTVDARADLYALGCILYEMVSARPPFVAEGSGELIAHHMMTQPDPPRAWNPNVSQALEEIILKLLAKNPADRYQNANELLIALGGRPVDEAGRSSGFQAAMPTPVNGDIRSQLNSGVRSQPGYPLPTPISAKPTTLSSAAGSTIPPSSGKRTGLIAGAAIVTVGLGIGLFVAFTHGDGKDKGTSTTIPMAAQPPAPPPPVTPEPKAVVPPPPPPAPVVETKPVEPAPDPVAETPVVVDKKPDDPGVAKKPHVKPPVVKKPIVVPKDDKPKDPATKPPPGLPTLPSEL